MRHVDYVVEPLDDEWTVSMRGERAGRFPSRLAALRSALEDAERVDRMGFEVSVWLRHPGRSSRKLPDRLLSQAAIARRSLGPTLRA
ncbi:hypothetical protein [Consotaella salsifontis]|nr:hypothetical protein [Consotaella salsifontis]